LTATLLLLLAAELNLVAVVLFVAGYRARTFERRRRVERFALLCLVVTLLAMGLLASTFFAILGGDSALELLLCVALPSLLPLAGWLGLVLRRRRAEARP